MNPVKIDNPTMQPYRCLFCTAGHKGGPVIDMLVDVLEGRAYICLQHAKRVAVAAGFAEGPELEKLENAAVLLAEAEKGIEDLNDLNASAIAKISEDGVTIERLTEERDQARIALKQAEDKLAELGQGIGATLAAVGGHGHLEELHAIGANLAHLGPSPEEAKLIEAHAQLDADVDCNAFPAEEASE